MLFRAGTAARFSGTEARQKGFISYTASNRKELAAALDLPADALQQDFAPAGALRAVRVDLKGTITRDMAEKARRMIQDAIRQEGANLVLVRVESAGGSPGDSATLANFLALDLDAGQVRTLAYVPKEARADAALIVLACDEIALHPKAELGGEGSYHFSPAEIADVAKTIRGITAKKGRTWSLPTAMIDPETTVFRCSKQGQAEAAFFSEKELAEQADAKAWIKGQQVTTGQPFRVRGGEASAYFSGVQVVDDFAKLKAAYGLQNDPALLEPSWVDTMVDLLSSPGVRVLLLVIGFVALYAELHSPGIGVPAFIATVCFVLFFWSQFGQTTGWLAITLFLAGMACVMLELFVLPGMGIFGFGGGILILASLVLASQTFIIPRNTYEFGQFRNSLLVVGAAVVGVIGAIAVINRWLPNAPILGQMVLQPPSLDETEAIDESGALAHYESLLGMRGTATTPLMPGGKARIGKDYFDVLTDGEFVPRNAAVEVVEIRGNWIVVRPVDDEA